MILAHPDKSSFNHAVASTAKQRLQHNGHHVFFHDLYEERFDPRLSAGEFFKDAVLPAAIAGHCEEISQAEGIIIIHPNWWGQPPAILKGWIDRVIRPGVAYEFSEGDSGEGVPVGLLKAKTAIVYNTSNTATDRELAVFGDPLETIWKNCVFGLCGVADVHRRIFNVIITSTNEQRRHWLDEVVADIMEKFPKIGSRTGLIPDPDFFGGAGSSI